LPDLSSIRNNIVSSLKKNGLRSEENQDIDYIIRALSGVIYAQQLRIDYLYDQIFPSSADEKYLTKFASDRGLFRAQPSKSRGFIVTPSETVIPIGTKLISKKGNEYTVIKRDANLISYQIESFGTGKEQNLIFNEVLDLLVPIDLLTYVQVDINGIQGGSDREALEDFRDRVITKLRSPGESGRVSDYYNQLKSRTELVKSFVFPARPIPGAVSWASLIAVGTDTWDFPNAAIKQSVTAFLNTKRPPSVKIDWLIEAKIILLNLTILGQISAAQKPLLTSFLKNQIFKRFVLYGAAEQVQTGELTEGVIRNLISSFLGGIDFNVVVSNPEKLGLGHLLFGEGLLIGTVTYA
jgi:hypothetical protein